MTLPPSGEFALIDAIVAELGVAGTGSHVVLGSGDDAALVTLPADHVLATSVDTLLPDVHFPARAAAELIGERALRVSVSDLAAMGAQPIGCVISLVLPEDSGLSWVRALSRGFAAAAQQFDCPVTGGNLTAGPLSICVTVQGAVPPRQALLRSGAQIDDDVWVSGALGGAAVALAEGELAAQVYAADVPDVSRGLTDAQRQYFFPQPQIELGIALRNIATSAIDISDGLAADLGHVARSSQVSMALVADAIPRLAGASLEQALYGGDDYQLCFTANPQHRELIQAMQFGVCRIGEVVACRSAVSELWLDDAPLQPGGFDHFAHRSGT